MPISIPSIRSGAAIGLVLMASGALAQDAARQKIEAAGSEAGQKIEDALAKSKAAPAKGPTRFDTPVATEADRRAAAGKIGAQRGATGMRVRAEKAAAQGEARLAEQREAMGRRLRQALGLEPAEPGAGTAKPVENATGWVPVLFVSSSVPVPVLRAYAAQLERIHGVLAFRGMPGGLRRVAPMAKLSAEILRLDPGCEGPGCAMRNVQVIIDPIAFRQHNISRVPALAMLPGDPAQAYCERDEGSARSRFIVYGDAALSGLLEEFRRLGGAAEVGDAQALLGAR
ncbi:type-F conjugative transfer system pilin assembly protein TrbC [Sphingomonas sp. MMS12-HWE2-04]|uniref:type-F conjugative transfer system pilin assembly protein TrbC n=1 Tax=Sphingomonas sp. MMS12-HWE2-04 TaxID=3234199 RepID=UPI00384D567C